MGDIYRDIAERTGGDVYIGVVGPVRSGKSTFLRRFTEEMILPSIENEYERERTRDEMPQSSGGKTVMTTEPKFVPEKASELDIEGARLSVKLIDCVGFPCEDAGGLYENGEVRMVKTPWQDAPMPFPEAARIGTEKVINEHATVAMLVTTDGTIGALPRESYVAAEEETASALKAIGKPFVVILNSAEPESEEAEKLAYSLEEKYSAPVALISCKELDCEDIKNIFSELLSQFPMREIVFRLPDYMSALPSDSPLYSSIKDTVSAIGEGIRCVGDIKTELPRAYLNPDIESAEMISCDLGVGCAEVEIKADKAVYYRLISDICKKEIETEGDMISVLQELSAAKEKYDRVAEALKEVEEKGYGIVMPDISELILEEPKPVKQNGGYGVKLKAHATSIHMIKANIEAEVSPIVGTEEQSEELAGSIIKEYEASPEKIWQTNFLGKSLYELVNEGLHRKLANMPEDSRKKLSETLERIINEGSGGLICIIL